MEAAASFALAQMELTLILVRNAQRVILTSTSTAVPDPPGVLVNRPSGGVPIHVRPRTNTDVDTAAAT